MLDKAKILEAQTDWDNLGIHEARLAAYCIIQLYTLSDPDSKRQKAARAKVERMTNPYHIQCYMQNAIALGARILRARANRDK